MLDNCVLHCRMIPQSLKLLLIESLREDVEIFMDLRNSLCNLLGLVVLNPVDPSAPENIPFWWTWNQIPSPVM